MNDVQEKLQRLREMGWSEESVADKLGIARFVVRAWSSGIMYPTHYDVILAALDALADCDPREDEAVRVAGLERRVDELEGRIAGLYADFHELQAQVNAPGLRVEEFATDLFESLRDIQKRGTP